MNAAVFARYQHELSERGYQSDPAQLRAVDALERCAAQWAHYKSKRANDFKKIFNHPPIPRGVYLYGSVGRGKSFLMDCFFDAVPLRRKTRLHFHEFMREVHRQMARLQGQQNPLDALGAQMAKRFKLICFDEFHVSDVTDAMILHRLLESLFANGVGLVATSNFHPDGLYPDGLHRDRIVPAIALLKEKLEIINVDGGVDYRQRTLEKLRLYLTPLTAQTDAELQADFSKLAGGHDEKPIFELASRRMAARRRAGDVIWFDFAELCGKPHGQNDYLEIASAFHTVVLSGVPQMNARMASAARRFTLLIDVLYDRRVKLIVSAAVPPDALYSAGPLAHEFVRTASRLHEMQTAPYLALEHRRVDVGIA